ncbi:MAG: hypothetical protein KKH52_02330 [Nanoarchaeota archaeon]|nr:hypothetical protein [Nanoarchaeota archaeon]MBU1623203.1 hypothetical protein [Nanoarchaeota archaeon]MBU1974209.1 hypothetical protein [Nanoarchaeota archaeon]
MDKTFQAKSIIISRKPGKDKEGLWTAFIGLFQENNPHLKGRAPFEVLDIKEVEKVRFWELRNISFYLMGNDIVINDLTEVRLKKEKDVLTVTGKQKL